MPADGPNDIQNFAISLLQDVSDAICLATADGKFFWANPYFNALFGSSALQEMNTSGQFEEVRAALLALTDSPPTAANKNFWQGTVSTLSTSGHKATFLLRIKGIPLAQQHPELYSLTFLESNAISNLPDLPRLLHYFAEHANDAIMITEGRPIDEPGPRIIYTNPAFTKISGFSREEVLGRSPRMLQGPKTDRAVLDNIRSTLEAKGTTTVELINYRKNGEKFWIEFSLVPVCDASGNLSHYVSIQRETTTIKQAEAALKKGEKELRKALKANKDLLKHSLDIICSVDPEGYLQQINPACKRIWGYSPEELTGKHLSDMLHPEDLEKTKKALMGINDNKTLEGFENRVLHKSGREVHMVWDMAWSDEYNLLYSIGRDLTQQLEIQRRLTKSEELYRTVVENFPNGSISILDQNFVFEFMAGRGPLEFNISSDYFIGKSFLDTLEPDEASRAMAALMPTFRGEMCTTELKFGERYFQCQSVPLREGDRIEKFMMVSQDITILKKAREELQRYAHELEKSNTELDQFVYKTSHDLRAPLLSVLGLINISLAEKDTHVRNEYLGLMTKSIKKLDAFIQDIISFSKSARTEVVTHEIDFNNLLNEVVEGLRYMEEAQNISFHINTENINGFFTDRRRLEVILHNMIANSIRYKDPRKEHAYINISAKLVDAKKLQLKIEDNGIGIAKEYQHKIYDMFFRATDMNVGSGLGLYIVKENVNKLKGEIRLSSVLSIGTTFYVTLPNLKKETHPPLGISVY